MSTIARLVLIILIVMGPRTLWAQWSADTSAAGAYRDSSQRGYAPSTNRNAAYSPPVTANAGAAPSPTRGYASYPRDASPNVDYPVRQAAYEEASEPASSEASPDSTAKYPSTDHPEELRLAQPAAESNSLNTKVGFDNMPAMVGSLGLVLGLFFLSVCLMRRGMSRGALRALPRDAVEVLGRVPLLGRQYAHLIRCGNKMLLVCATPTGAETLTEITDPEEVDRLAGLCHSRASRGGATAAEASYAPSRSFDRELASSTLFGGSENDRMDFSHLSSIGSHGSGSARDA